MDEKITREWLGAINDDLDKIEKRISELREYIKINTANIQDNFKGFKDFKFLQESQMKRSDHLQEQINELEKKLEAERKTKIWDTKVINKMNKGIDELKKELGNPWIEKVNNELNELKDWFLEYHDYELEKVQEVLRDIGKVIISAFVILQVPDNRIKTIEEQLKKLDSQGKTEAIGIKNGQYQGLNKYLARQQTETENPKGYMWLCQSCHHLYDSSRGEKELSAHEGSHKTKSSAVESVKIPTSCRTGNDSKPPEPICKCGHEKSWHSGLTDMCSCGCSQFIEDRLPGGTGTEPREDDLKTVMKIFEQKFYKDHILVKREDLYWMYYELPDHADSCNKTDLEKFWDTKKRIKEAYKIE